MCASTNASLDLHDIGEAHRAVLEREDLERGWVLIKLSSGAAAIASSRETVGADGETLAKMK